MGLLGTIRTWQMLDKVCVSVRVYSGSREEAESDEDLFYVEFWFPDEGETDPRTWIKDALLYALEEM
jgi:hypothetical protein